MNDDYSDVDGTGAEEDDDDDEEEEEEEEEGEHGGTHKAQKLQKEKVVISRSKAQHPAAPAKLVIPLVLATTLEAGSYVTIAGAFVIATPCFLPACVNMVLESVEFFGCVSVEHNSCLVKATGCMFAYVRVVQLSPRLLAGAWVVVLGYMDVIAIRTGLDAGAQMLTFSV